MIQWVQLLEFQALCENAGVETPNPIVRALELVDLARAEKDKPIGSVLDLSDDDVPAKIAELSLRGHAGVREALGLHTDGLATGVEAFENAVLSEVREACLPELDRIIVDLGPRFDAAAAPLIRGAQEFNFTWETTSDEVIRRRDAATAEAWADIPAAFAAIVPFAHLREYISRTFEVSPTLAEMRKGLGIYGHDPDMPEDYSICFAAGMNWNLNGANYVTGKRRDQKLGQIDWLGMAKGGLHLNTPDEVRAKYAERRRLLAAPTAG